MFWAHFEWFWAILSQFWPFCIWPILAPKWASLAIWHCQREFPQGNFEIFLPESPWWPQNSSTMWGLGLGHIWVDRVGNKDSRCDSRVRDANREIAKFAIQIAILAILTFPLLNLHRKTRFFTRDLFGAPIAWDPCGVKS
jgi:hypothetical protein